MSARPAANLYIAAVLAAGAMVVGASLYGAATGALDARHLGWPAIALLTVLAGHISLRLPLRNCKVSFSDGFIFLSILMFGPDLATLTGALDGFAASTRHRSALHKTLFNTAAMATSVYVSSRLFRRIVPHDATVDGFAAGTFLLAVLVMTAAQFVLNTALVSVAIALKEGVSLVAIWQNSLRWAGSACLVGSAGAALVFGEVQLMYAGSLIAILPFPVILFLTYRDRLRRPQARKVPAPALRRVV